LLAHPQALALKQRTGQQVAQLQVDQQKIGQLTYFLFRPSGRRAVASLANEYEYSRQSP